MIKTECEVELLGCYGDDKRAVESARVSFFNDDFDYELDRLDEKDNKLLKFLVQEGHTSPFEHSYVTFRVSCPLFIRNQIMRHRTFSYNEASRRYTDKEISFYVPQVLHEQSKDNLQCSNENSKVEHDYLYINDIKYHIEESSELYFKLLEAGVSREQARQVLPQSLFTTFWMSGNLHNFIKFIKARNTEHSQKETRRIAQSMLANLIRHFPYTMREHFPESFEFLGYRAKLTEHGTIKKVKEEKEGA